MNKYTVIKTDKRNNEYTYTVVTGEMHYNLRLVREQVDYLKYKTVGERFKNLEELSKHIIDEMFLSKLEILKVEKADVEELPEDCDFRYTFILGNEIDGNYIALFVDYLKTRDNRYYITDVCYTFAV